MASCIQQGIDADAGAIITGSIPQELVSVAFESAQKAGIPIVNTMTAPAGPGDPTQVAYLTPDYITLQSMSSNWVIADSDAAANVLYVQITDTPATILWAEQGALATYEKSCPDCEVTVIKANTGQFDKLPSLVTSELTKNPDIDYVQTEVDFAVQPTVEGLQAANATSVKIASMDGVLATLQMLEAGQFVHSEVGFNVDALGWYAADQALRMMAGPAQQHRGGLPLPADVHRREHRRAGPHTGGREVGRVVRLDRLPGRLPDAVGPRRLTPAHDTRLTGCAWRRSSGVSRPRRHQLGTAARSDSMASAANPSEATHDGSRWAS